MALVGARKLTDEETAARGLELDQQLQVLLERAKRWGFVVTVHTEPIPGQPLAMGRHRMVGSIRPRLVRAKG